MEEQPGGRATTRAILGPIARNTATGAVALSIMAGAYYLAFLLRFDFDINMVCIARERMDKDVHTKISQTKYQEAVVEKSFITVQAKGDYPLLRFEDVRNDQESIANM